VRPRAATRLVVGQVAEHLHGGGNDLLPQPR
jgi:hypothetical protein